MIKSFQINIFSLRLYSCSLLLQGFFQLLNKDANNCANVFNVGTGYDHKIWMFSIIWLCLLPSLNKLFNHFLCLKYQLKQEKKKAEHWNQRLSKNMSFQGVWTRRVYWHYRAIYSTTTNQRKGCVYFIFAFGENWLDRFVQKFRRRFAFAYKGSTKFTQT